LRFIRPKIVKDLYGNILKRPPSDEEIAQFMLDHAKSPNLPGRIRSMIDSKEFEIMIMPELVRRASEEYGDKKIFFLHVPKTAGTSVRLALTDAIGIPSFNLYPRSTHGSPSNASSMNFWPYWAGHANLSIFPSSHSGFSVFRETRSRILSRFRQSQFELAGNNPHLIHHRKENASKKELSKNASVEFNQWIRSQPSSIVHYYIPNPEKSARSSTWVAEVDKFREVELQKILKESMKRFESVAWIHQPEDVVAGIRKITGNENATLPMENEFRKTSLYKEEIIEPESMEIMNRAAKLDNLVFQASSDLGIMVNELNIDKDEIFENSLKRLGFRLK
jgi:hypothetical protein